MGLNKDYHYYELREFSFDDECILNLITTNYIRSFTIKKDYDILVITNSNNDFDNFVKYVNNVLESTSLNDINDYIINHQRKNNITITKKELNKLKCIKIIQMKKKDYEKYNNENDFVILNSITKHKLKKIVIDKTQHDRNEDPVFLQNFIYLLHYKNKFDKIYKDKKILGNFYYPNNIAKNR